MTSFDDAKILMHERKVDAILVVPPNFSATLSQGNAKLQLILYGGDSATATSIQGYIEGSIRQLNLQSKTSGYVSIENRMWFNDINSSTWYFIPGILVLVMTIVGVFLRGNGRIFFRA